MSQATLVPFKGEPRFSAPNTWVDCIVLDEGNVGAMVFTLVHAVHNNNATHVAIDRLFICRILDGYERIFGFPLLDG